MEIFTDYISNIGNQFIDPKKRVFVAYIGISILIAFLWFILLRKYSLFAAFKKIFDKKTLFEKIDSPKKFWVKKKLIVRKNFGFKKIFGQENFWLKKNCFGHKNFSSKKNIRKIFGRKKNLAKKVLAKKRL